ncbi:MAG TPA: hypothetical protein VK730_00050 [Solirubrobacteraceae bacterium]|jgi:hypothetical protein|nr:hypothetical protein [Solirubrobacteraceae bacterium]
MYHVELRQFPHNFCRFNLTETELHEAVLDAWARGEWIEFGERKWNPQQAKLIVVEGPQIPLEQLSMGRGWRIVEREGKDVTEQLIEAAHNANASAAASAVTSEQARAQAAATLGLDPAAASLVAELLGLLGEEPLPLMRAWQLALEGHPDRTPSECLALAEGLVRG